LAFGKALQQKSLTQRRKGRKERKGKKMLCASIDGGMSFHLDGYGLGFLCDLRDLCVFALRFSFMAQCFF
jgi:hypothetical protein